jgi:hypothetical protein
MEGLAVEFHLANLLRKYKAGNLDVEELKQQLGFISHFLDVSRQDCGVLPLKRLMDVADSIVAEPPDTVPVGLSHDCRGK